jgi:spore maturation protein CgeB
MRETLRGRKYLGNTPEEKAAAARKAFKEAAHTCRARAREATKEVIT